MKRPPSSPPALPGFTYVEPLGAGGFADVFLYEQEMPRRRVAVKVLLADRLSSGAAQEFADEANVMAMLSTHPAIVTIYQAGVAGDGRPYLVMEYCPRPNLQTRSRKEPFSVAEALRVGVQVAGAVETAHRAGVLHRDIKPANILVTEYNRPALTDFGIASTTGATTEASGMSIPWSPPESFAEPPRSGPRSDVWALGATLFTLLAGRSPFERPGERNSSADLIERIERAAVPHLGRPDSPESLQRVLERAMAKNSDDRYPSAVAFARALQKVQIELSHSVTPIDIVDEHPHADELEDDDDGLTRVREVVSIDPDASAFTRPSATTQKHVGQPAPSVPRFDPAPAQPVSDRTEVRGPVIPPPPPVDDEPTLLRPPQVVSPAGPPAPGFAASPASSAPAYATAPSYPTAPPHASSAPSTTPAGPPRRRTGLWISLIAAGVVVVVVAAIIGLNLLAAGIRTDPAPEASETAEPQDVVPDFVPAVSEPVGVREGATVTFTWENPSPEEGDSYLWRDVYSDDPDAQRQTDVPTVTVESAERVCIDVILRRADGRASEPMRGCVG